MKITKRQLRQIIQEELSQVLNESAESVSTGSPFPKDLSYGHLSPEETQEILIDYPLAQGIPASKGGAGFTRSRILAILDAASEAARLKGELGNLTPQEDRERRERYSREDALRDEIALIKKGGDVVGTTSRESIPGSGYETATAEDLQLQYQEAQEALELARRRSLGGEEATKQFTP